MLTLLLACTGDTNVSTLDHPELVVAPQAIDFGEVVFGIPETQTFTVSNTGGVPMGLDTVEVAFGHLENFTLVLGEADCATDGILQPGCAVTADVTLDPVDAGSLFASVQVTTVTTPGDDPETRGNTDLNSNVAYVQLSGSVVRDEGRVSVSPRSLDFGTISPGDDSTLYAEVENTGDGVLTLYEPLAENCEDAFSFTPSWQFGDELGAGETATVAVTYAPEDIDGTVCGLLVATDDGSWPNLEVELLGNLTEATTNTPPVIEIQSPQPLHYVGGSSFDMTLKVTDAEQPATSLQCQILSANLLHATLSSCTPDDDSGVIEVEIKTNGFPDGTDTIVVTAIDSQQTPGRVSIPLLMDIEQPADDDDDDGYGDADDCDDTNITVYPYAVELEDGLDNDCDEAIDENTPAVDQDNDSYKVADGDCNDHDSSTHPGATEVLDYRDNDCDGDVDNGTLRFDDDGDGYAEVHGDCDDDDDEAFPNAVEFCNDLDDDCDGVIDDDCIALTGPPLALTGVVATSTAVAIGGETTVSMVVLDEQALTWSWSASDGTFADLTAENAVWTAPLTAGVYTITGRALDEDNNEVWGFGDIEVVEASDLDGIAVIDEGEPTGCSTAPGASLALLGLLAITRRR